MSNTEVKTRKVGVIIKHPYRDYDWRIDICEVPEDMKHEEITNYIMSQMLGPFEVVGISERINYDRKVVRKVVDDVPAGGEHFIKGDS